MYTQQIGDNCDHNAQPIDYYDDCEWGHYVYFDDSVVIHNKHKPTYDATTTANTNDDEYEIIDLELALKDRELYECQYQFVSPNTQKKQYYIVNIVIKILEISEYIWTTVHNLVQYRCN